MILEGMGMETVDILTSILLTDNTSEMNCFPTEQWAKQAGCAQRAGCRQNSKQPENNATVSTVTGVSNLHNYLCSDRNRSWAHCRQGLHL